MGYLSGCKFGFNSKILGLMLAVISIPFFSQSVRAASILDICRSHLDVFEHVESVNSMMLKIDLVPSRTLQEKKSEIVYKFEMLDVELSRKFSKSDMEDMKGKQHLRLQLVLKTSGALREARDLPVKIEQQPSLDGKGTRLVITSAKLSALRLGPVNLKNVVFKLSQRSSKDFESWDALLETDGTLVHFIGVVKSRIIEVRAKTPFDSEPRIYHVRGSGNFLFGG